MAQSFFEKPILNSPYEYPCASTGSSTLTVSRPTRSSTSADPRPTLRRFHNPRSEEEGERSSAGARHGPGGAAVQTIQIINELRQRVDAWRNTSDPRQWHVTPETQRLLQHWRTTSSRIRPFFCQVEAVETAIWLTEVAPKDKDGKTFLAYLAGRQRRRPTPICRDWP